MPDGHLSGDEDSEAEKKQVKQQLSKQTYQQFYLDFRAYSEGRDKTMDEQVENYRIINTSSQSTLF